MSRVAVGILLALLAAIAATLLFALPQDSRELENARHEELLRRMDKLEHSLAQLALADGAGPVRTAAAPSVSETPRSAPEPSSAAVNDVAAPDVEILDAIAIVDRAVSVARWTPEDVTALATATAGLSASDRSDVYARLSAAINADRVQVDPAALQF